MNRNDELYSVESEKSVGQFVADFSEVVKKHDFVINNLDTMNMKNTFHEHGGTVTDEFDLYMMHVCKPTKSAASLSINLERSILMPKFVMAFSRNGKTQVRYLSYSAADISELVLDDPKFQDSLAQTYKKIRSMIDEAR